MIEKNGNSGIVNLKGEDLVPLAYRQVIPFNDIDDSIGCGTGQRVAAVGRAVGRVGVLVMIGLHWLGRTHEAHEQRERIAWMWRESERRALLQARYGRRVGPVRTVAGMVVGPDGTPVADAQVAVARGLMGDSHYLVRPLQLIGVIRYGVRTTRTDGNGRFSFDEVPDGPFFAAAESSDGRSAPAFVDLGQQSGIELALQPFAHVRGRVRILASPHRRQRHLLFLRAQDDKSEAQMLVVPVAADGSFGATRLAPGAYEVRMVHTVGITQVMRTVAQVELAAGQTETLALDLSADDEQPVVTLEVLARGTFQLAISAAQVMIWRSDQRAMSIRELRRSMGGAPRSWKSFPMAARPGARQVSVAVSDVTVGRYNVCVLPFPGDPLSPEIRGELVPLIEELLVQCVPVVVEPQPPVQRVTVDFGQLQAPADSR